MRIALGLSVLIVLGSSGCKNKDDGEAATAPTGVGEVGVRRLSRHEYNRTVNDLLQDDSNPANVSLPEDILDPFDNDFLSQDPTAIVVTGLEITANDIATRLLEDGVRRDDVVGCTTEDELCMRSFVAQFGRLALRRPLTVLEIEGLTDAGMTHGSSDFYEGVDVVLRVLLQHPEFVYRVEVGTPTASAGVYALNDWEVATRLSYFVWGTTPDDWLLDKVAAGELATGAQIRAVADEMLRDERAYDRVDRFHAMWLAYYTLPHDPELTQALRAETRTLVTETLLDDGGAWFDIFLADGTTIGDDLAEHYGLRLPGTDIPTWVSYGDTDRMGLLSHGSFLSVNAKFGDSSPTLRGRLIRERLLCQIVPPPPPGVNVDEPPASADPDACKHDRYEAHRSNGACKSCHDLMDPLGFGLENFDQEGRYRSHDVGAPECEVSGEGDLDGQPFVGPAGLSQQLVDSPSFSVCAIDQLYRMAMGHDVASHDAAMLDRLTTAFADGDFRYDQLVLALVEDDAFRHRREEEVSP